MTFHDKTEQQVIEMFNSNSHNGLSPLLVDESIKKYGAAQQPRYCIWNPGILDKGP